MFLLFLPPVRDNEVWRTENGSAQMCPIEANANVDVDVDVGVTERNRVACVTEM